MDFALAAHLVSAVVVYVTRKIDKARELANDLRIRRNVRPLSLSCAENYAENIGGKKTRLVVSARTKNGSVKLPNV